MSLLKVFHAASKTPEGAPKVQTSSNSRILSRTCTVIDAHEGHKHDHTDLGYMHHGLVVQDRKFQRANGSRQLYRTCTGKLPTETNNLDTLYDRRKSRTPALLQCHLVSTQVVFKERKGATAMRNGVLRILWQLGIRQFETRGLEDGIPSESSGPACRYNLYRWSTTFKGRVSDIKKHRLPPPPARGTHHLQWTTDHAGCFANKCFDFHSTTRAKRKNTLRVG